MKTAVVILNWNTEDYLRRFLPPLLESCEGQDAEVIVADNASTDSSLKVLSEEFPSVRTIALDANYGFTGGYNRALAQIDAEYFILINSDIEVPRDWLSPLVEWMDSHPGCGVCGPKLLSLQDRGRFEYAGAAGGYIDRFGYPFCRGRVLSLTEPDRGQYDSPRDVLWVSGACLCTRSSLYRRLGGLDDRFFAHMEEIDYCWRAGLEGFKVTVVPASRVYHLGGGTLPQSSPFKLKLNYRNNLLLLENNLPRTAGPLRARLRIAFRYALDLGSALVYLLGGKKAELKAVTQAHREYRALRGAAAAGRKSGKTEVTGYKKNVLLLPAAFIHGKDIFSHIID